MDLLLKYFPDITTEQKQQFAQMQAVYLEWNEKINVISRKDIDNLYERHVLHSLAIAKFVSFKPGAKIMDLGTGGGFPGVPLAILFPDARFHLVDSIAKKLKVIEAVKESCGLQNIFTFHSRAEEMPYQYDFVVTRAVAPVKELLQWTKGKYLAKSQHNRHNGLIALKGGDLTEELKDSGIANATVLPLTGIFTEESFKEKALVYIRR
ncbi:MAG: 16S rRNA (guanine(527)-N(7))-methyltransferase RsmG [Chitinophagales bacterium]|nr:16S rRNA (guanine(527)-N(7))-methyltransferase RsmG [Chitinophagales bacterium]